MNWFTGRFISGCSTAHKKELAERDSCCEHVEADPSVAYYYGAENDSFGTVGSHVNCKDCYEKAQAAEDEELVTCADCGNVVKSGDTISWRWYDFYAPQGDEPLIICNSCRTKEKHIQRVRKDRADLDEEMDGWD